MSEPGRLEAGEVLLVALDVVAAHARHRAALPVSAPGDDEGVGLILGNGAGGAGIKYFFNSL